MSTLGVILFLGENFGLIGFGIKIAIIIFLFIWIRASFPRIRYDQLMTLL